MVCGLVPSKFTVPVPAFNVPSGSNVPPTFTVPEPNEIVCIVVISPRNAILPVTLTVPVVIIKFDWWAAVPPVIFIEAAFNVPPLTFKSHGRFIVTAPVTVNVLVPLNVNMA